MSGGRRLAPSLASNDPLKFTDTKPYKSRLTSTQKATGLKDAVIVGVGKINGVDAVMASMEYSFIGGSMGVVVGEKIVRGIELALERRIAMHHRVVLGRRPHDGGRAVADADGEDLGGAGAPRPCAAALHLDPDRSDDRRRHRELCDAGRSQHRRTKGVDWFCGTARDRADHPPETAGRFPAQRIPARARHARSRHRSARDEGDDSATRCVSWPMPRAQAYRNHLGDTARTAFRSRTIRHQARPRQHPHHPGGARPSRDGLATRFTSPAPTARARSRRWSSGGFARPA